MSTELIVNNRKGKSQNSIILMNENSNTTQIDSSFLIMKYKMYFMVNEHFGKQREHNYIYLTTVDFDYLKFQYRNWYSIMYTNT